MFQRVPVFGYWYLVVGKTDKQSARSLTPIARLKKAPRQWRGSGWRISFYLVRSHLWGASFIPLESRGESKAAACRGSTSKSIPACQLM